MLRQKIFCTFLWFTLPILLLISIAAFVVSHIIRDHDKIYTLEQFSNVMSTLVNEEGTEAIDSLRYHDNGFRITIIDISGKVLFDTERNPALLENHLSREEVSEAIKNGKGASQRFSSTLEQQTYYQAVRLNNGDILRISFVTETMLTYTLRMAAYMIVLLIFIIAASYFIARSLAKYLMEPFDKIDLNHPLTSNTYDELLPFLSRISEQQHKIDEQIAALNRKSNELQVIIKSMSDGLVLLNAQGTILTINKIARKIFGVTKENCINQNYLSIDHSQYMQDLMTNQSQQPKQTMQITKDGRDYEIRFNRIEDEKKCLGFAMMILDVTDKVRSEQMRQEFTANVSHELKTPLQSIIGYSELMANGLVRSDDIKPFAERIHKQSTRLQNLIEDIILLSSLDEGSTALTEPVSLLQITTEVFDNLQEKAGENHITLNIEGKDIMFVGVNRYMYELIYNLVDNAIRYNKPYGSVKVSLKSNASRYQIEVKDTGIGVSPAEQYRIFERFYRVDKSHSRKTGGTGLGLSIVKRVVMFHQGKIKVQSVLGEGTSFTVTFYKDKLEQVVAENQLKQQQQIHESRQSTVVSTASGEEIAQDLEQADSTNVEMVASTPTPVLADQPDRHDMPYQANMPDMGEDNSHSLEQGDLDHEYTKLANAPSNNSIASDATNSANETDAISKQSTREGQIIRRPSPIADFSHVFERTDEEDSIESLGSNFVAAKKQESIDVVQDKECELSEQGDINIQEAQVEQGIQAAQGGAQDVQGELVTNAKVSTETGYTSSINSDSPSETNSFKSMTNDIAQAHTTAKNKRSMSKKTEAKTVQRKSTTARKSPSAESAATKPKTRTRRIKSEQIKTTQFARSTHSSQHTSHGNALEHELHGLNVNKPRTKKATNNS